MSRDGNLRQDPGRLKMQERKMWDKFHVVIYIEKKTQNVMCVVALRLCYCMLECIGYLVTAVL